MSRIKLFLQIFFLSICNLISSQNINSIEVSNDNSIELHRKSFYDSLPKPNNWTNDYENLFSDEEETKLNKIIDDFEKETSIEIAIVTIDSFKVSKDGFDALLLHIANTWGIGKKDKSNGIFIAISKDHRKIRIQNGDGIVQIISDEETSMIIQNHIIPFFKKEDYFEGTLSGLLNIINLLRTKQK